MAFNIKNVLNNNILAIVTAKKIHDDENSIVSSEENQVLKEYKGFGGIKAILLPMDTDWSSLDNVSKSDLKLEKDIKEFHSYVFENFENPQNIWNSVKESVLTSFYTPEFFIDLQISNVYKNNPNNINSILDPCAGNGAYIDSFLKFYPEAEVVAIEKDDLAAFILSAKYKKNQKVKIINDGFEAVNFNQKFDLISSNIPFGNFKVKFNKYDSKITDKIHNFFFYHSMNLLNEGGVLSFLTSTGVFNSPSNRFLREELAKEIKFLDITTLPNNLFIDNGTEVTTHLVQGIKEVNTLDQNKFINTSNVNDVIINDYIYENFLTSFLETPKIDTDPYGRNEYNYRMDLDQISESFKVNVTEIPQLTITENSQEEKNIQFQKFPLPFFSYDEILKEGEIRLLRDKSLLHSAEIESYKTIAIASANYKGKEVPLFTVSKFQEIQDDNNLLLKKKYIIDYYTEEINGKAGERVLTTKEFKLEFENLTDKLHEISKKESLKVSLHLKNSNDSIEFEKYFYSRFNQPYIYKTYQPSFENFSFHKDKSVGMLCLNRFYEPSVIFEILNQDGTVYYGLEELKTNSEDKDLIKDYLLIYDAYNMYLQAERASVDNLEIFRERLNIQYDNFVANHGYINENKRICNYDFNYYSILKTLENGFQEIDEQIDLFNSKKIKTWSKADILFSPAADPEILDINLALAKSFNAKGKINVDYIAELSNTDVDQVLQELNDKIVKNPVSNDYELRSMFFSGNIQKKINEISELNNPDNVLLISELTACLPTIIPFESINIQMGSRWLPLDILDNFLENYFDQRFTTIYNENLDNFFVEPKSFTGNYSAKYVSFTHTCVSGRYITAEDIIQNAFFDLYPIVTYKNSEEIKVTDDVATKYYKREITKIRKEFLNYLYDLPVEKKDKLTKLYNDKFNNIVIPNYDPEILDFKDFDLKAFGIPDIYQHQKRAPWKIINNHGGIVDHEVGLGKTFEIVATAHFGKKLGVFNKPIITGIKANVADIATAYRTLLPNANVLFASQKEFSTKEREAFLNRIKNNNYDVVIMSHEQFTAIPQSPEVEEIIVSQELKDVEDNLLKAKDVDISKQQLKGLEIKKKNLDAKLDTLLERIRNRKDDNVLNFKDLGIDHIIIDESHKFKNLMFQTKHTRVAGLGDVNGSQRANNMLTAIRSIQEKTKNNEYGATFFSGTTISNSLTELYLLQKYLTPISLKERGIYNFDAWCSNFAEKSIEFETNLVNQIISKERFRYFVNLPELSMMYNQMADVMTGEMAKIDRPDKNEFLILNEQTPLQKRFYVKLKKFLDSKDQTVLGLDQPLNIDTQSTAISLVAMNLAFKASLDMRLISSSYRDEPGSKINKTVKELISRYRKFDEQKMTQIVFLDISTPKKKFSFQELEHNYNNNIFTSLYDDMKYKLIKSGIPENEIAYIQDYKTENKKKVLSDKMNSGEIRFLFGGTENAGTGLNVQKRLGFINHLSIPWKPSELDQRNGRGFRTGNWFSKNFNENKIDIGISATKNTLDNYKIDLNKNKQTFINQLKGASIGLQVARKIDEGSMDENSGMSLAELQAQLTGDNTMLLKFKVDNQIKELEQDRYFILSKNRETDQKIENSEKKIREYEAIKSLYVHDYETYKSNVRLDDKGVRINKPIYYDLATDPSSEDVYNLLEKTAELAENFDGYTEKPVGELFGFQMYVVNNAWSGAEFKVRNLNSLENSTRLNYHVNEGKINLDSVQSAVTFFIRSIDTIHNKLKNVDDNIALETKKLEAYKLSSGQVFTQEEKLNDLKLESERLEDKIKSSTNLNAIEYEVKALKIEDEEVNFKIISSIDILEKAVLNEHLGKQNESIGFFCSNRVREFLNEISDSDKSGFRILNQQLDFKDHKHFMKIRVKDYDDFYCSVENNAKIESISCLSAYQNLEEDGHNNFFITNDDHHYHCYNNTAEKFSELLDLPINTVNGISTLTITSEIKDSVTDKLEIFFSKEVSFINHMIDSGKTVKLR